MKIIKEPDEVHDCGRELRREAEDHCKVLAEQLGKQAQCSCGRVYELRKSGFFRYAFSIEPFGHEESRHPAQAYWHFIGWSEP